MTRTRPATIEEMKAAKPAGSKVSFEHAAYETARRVRGEWRTVHRKRTTATIHYDDRGAFIMRKDQREDIKATHATFDDCRPFVCCFRAAYLD